MSHHVLVSYGLKCILIRVRPIPCRRLIPDTIGHSCTDADTGLYKFFVLKMRFCAGYRCVQVIYVCGVYVRKYGIGLKL